MFGRAASFSRGVYLAGLLVFVDAFYFGQGMIGALLGIVLFLIVLPLTFLPRFASGRRQRLRNLGIYSKPALPTGRVACDTLKANAVIAQSDTLGAGNVW